MLQVGAEVVERREETQKARGACDRLRYKELLGIRGKHMPSADRRSFPPPSSFILSRPFSIQIILYTPVREKAVWTGTPRLSPHCDVRWTRSRVWTGRGRTRGRRARPDFAPLGDALGLSQVGPRPLLARAFLSLSSVVLSHAWPDRRSGRLAWAW